MEKGKDIVDSELMIVATAALAEEIIAELNVEDPKEKEQDE